MNKVVSREHKIVSSHLRDLLSAYLDSEDLINVGAYVKGTSPRVDKAIKIYDEIINFFVSKLKMMKKRLSLEDVFDRMIELARKAENN